MGNCAGAKKTQPINAEKSIHQATQNQNETIEGGSEKKVETRLPNEAPVQKIEQNVNNRQEVQEDQKNQIKTTEQTTSVHVQQVSKKPTEIKQNISDKTSKTEEKKEDQSPQTQNKPSNNTSDGLNESSGTPTSEEKELIKIINQYRQEKGLKAIPLSVSLTKVAQIHARDIVENSPDVDGGNMHSWSDKGSWKPCKYTSDHKQAALMWSKPSELTSYKGHGFEIAHGYSGEARKTYQTDAKTALDGWKKSSGHNAVIIEDGIWKGKNFQALGVGIYKGFACAWFGLEPDKAEQGTAIEPKVNKIEEAVKILEKKQDQTSQTQNKPSNDMNESFGTPTSEEKELINIINQYRQEKGLKAIPLSVSLTKVAQIHARDIVENSPDVDGGNMHSWSDKGNWKPCKYTSDHKQAALMWSKPSELTSYKGHGFEIAHGYSGEARKTYQTTAKSALDGWKKSSGHNAVIIEDGIWKGKNFQALGVGIYKGFACAWFGLEPDKTS